MSDQRPPVYTENGHAVYRASAFGLPLRSLVAARLGHEPVSPPPIVREAGQEGTRLEHVIKRSLSQPVSRSQEQVEFRHGRALVRGHIDGCCSVGLLEVKTVSDAGLTAWRVKRWDERPGWAWQVSAYCAGLGFHRVLMAVQARDTGELDCWEADVPYGPIDLRHRLDTLEHFVGLGELPPADPGYSGWDPWNHLHKLQAEEDGELASLLREYDRLNGGDKETAARKVELRGLILMLMGDRGKVSASGYEASFSKVSTERFDTEGFKRAHPEIYRQFLRVSKSERLVVRRAIEAGWTA